MTIRWWMILAWFLTILVCKKSESKRLRKSLQMWPDIWSARQWSFWLCHIISKAKFAKWRLAYVHVMHTSSPPTEQQLHPDPSPTESFCQMSKVNLYSTLVVKPLMHWTHQYWIGMLNEVRIFEVRIICSNSNSYFNPSIFVSKLH